MEFTSINEVVEHNKQICTYAATKNNPFNQHIYTCRTCYGTSEEQLLCICQYCSQVCHDGHDIEYIGFGLSYCDCSSSNNNSCGNNRCLLIEESYKICNQFGIKIGNADNKTDNHIFERSENKNVNNDNNHDTFPYNVSVYTIPSLFKNNDRDINNINSSISLSNEAKELIKHTKETHWLSCSYLSSKSNGHHTENTNGIESLCNLEKLALNMLYYHLRNTLNMSDDTLQETMLREDTGVEWWVQVLKSNDSDDKNDTNGIDLHYDKDEVLAELLDLGSFPLLSTVTYLSGASSSSSYPTLIFPYTYDDHCMNNDDGSNVMKDVCISYPKEGKHLVFDGRLLHGVSSDSRFLISDTGANADNDKLKSSSVNRVTFLANIWLHGNKPCSISELDPSIRQTLNNYDNFPLFSNMSNTSSYMKEYSIPTKTLSALSNEEIEELETASIPFVRNKKINSLKEQEEADDEDYDDSLVVNMIIPPISCHDNDTVHLIFNEGMEAFLEYPYEDDSDNDSGEEDDDDDDCSSKNNI